MERGDIGGFGHETVTLSQWLHFAIRRPGRRVDGGIGDGGIGRGEEDLC